MNNINDDLVLMHKNKDGKYICVPASKVNAVLNNDNNSEEHKKRVENLKKRMNEDFLRKRTEFASKNITKK